MNLLKNLKRKLMVPVLVTGLVGISLTGCNKRIETSEKLFEDAKVVEMEHKDSYRKQEYGLKYDGKLGWRTVNHPEKNIVKFDGEVDFEVDNKEIYGMFKEGDTARVCYKESYLITFGDLDKDGEKEEIDRQVRGYQFLDANLK
jgi:hypothetical protein